MKMWIALLILSCQAMIVVVSNSGIVAEDEIEMQFGGSNNKTDTNNTTGTDNVEAISGLMRNETEDENLGRSFTNFGEQSNVFGGSYGMGGRHLMGQTFNSGFNQHQTFGGWGQAQGGGQFTNQGFTQQRPNSAGSNFQLPQAGIASSKLSPGTNFAQPQNGVLQLLQPGGTNFQFPKTGNYFGQRPTASVFPTNTYQNLYGFKLPSTAAGNQGTVSSSGFPNSQGNGGNGGWPGFGPTVYKGFPNGASIAGVYSFVRRPSSQGPQSQIGVSSTVAQDAVQQQPSLGGGFGVAPGAVLPAASGKNKIGFGVTIIGGTSVVRPKTVVSRGPIGPKKVDTKLPITWRANAEDKSKSDASSLTAGGVLPQPGAAKLTPGGVLPQTQSDTPTGGKQMTAEEVSAVSKMRLCRTQCRIEFTRCKTQCSPQWLTQDCANCIGQPWWNICITC